MKMNKLILLLLIPFLAFSQKKLFTQKGMQPDFYVHKNGNIDLVFGLKNTIYYSKSTDKGQHFSEPQIVDSLTGLHLGMSRGPRIASSNHSIIITAIDKKGNVHAYRKEIKDPRWKHQLINDIPEVAKEGFNAIATNSKGKFMVIWLDLRGNKKNKLMSTLSNNDGKSWQPNKLIYASPDSTICECCQPNIIFNQNRITIMFRNWIKGSRDMYTIHSFDEGQTFKALEKQGEGTWKLNACPMDGGSLAFTQDNKIVSVWRREGNLYLSKEGDSKEIKISEGRNGSISVGQQTIFMAWHVQGKIYIKSSLNSEAQLAGEGRYPILKSLNEQESFVVWENQGAIFGKLVQ
jgi:hypothetical protein